MARQMKDSGNRSCLVGNRYIRMKPVTMTAFRISIQLRLPNHLVVQGRIATPIRAATVMVVKVGEMRAKGLSPPTT